MNELLVGLLGALVATNQSLAVSNAVQKATGIAISVPNPDDPVEKAYRQLLEEDDAVQAEIDRWIQDNNKFRDQGAGVDDKTLNLRIERRREELKNDYEKFIRAHPDHARARLAYGSFLGDTQDEEGARLQWEKALELDPTNPAAWNNLANFHGHRGSVTNAFAYYQKAIDLDPTEPVYYQNFATTVYLFRHDATNYFHIPLIQVFEKAMGLYQKALDLDPANFLLATELAQSYYGYNGFLVRSSGGSLADSKMEDALADKAIAAWLVALKLARDDIERQGVHVHLARIQINAGRFEGARQNLAEARHEMFNTTKKNLLRKLERLEAEAQKTTPQTR